MGTNFGGIPWYGGIAMPDDEPEAPAAPPSRFDSALGLKFKLKSSGRTFTVMSSVSSGSVEIMFDDDRTRTRYTFAVTELEKSIAA